MVTSAEGSEAEGDTADAGSEGADGARLVASGGDRADGTRDRKARPWRAAGVPLGLLGLVTPVLILTLIYCRAGRLGRVHDRSMAHVAGQGR
jgi:hypothetical protein